VASTEVGLADVKGAILVVGGLFLLLFGSLLLSETVITLYYENGFCCTTPPLWVSEGVQLGIASAFIVVAVILLLWGRQVFKRAKSPPT